MEKETKKLNYNDLEESKELVLRFRNEFLHGNIDKLANFSFWDIAGNSNYDGTCTPNSLGKFDGDKTKIVYSIDYLLYHDLNIPDFSIGKYGNYDGDTINTFRTLFGNRFVNDGETKIQSDFEFSSDEINVKNEFFRTYQKIGNFYLLPKGKTKDGRQTLNQYRGTDNDYKDFFDIFLKNLSLTLQNRGNDETINYLVKETETGKNVDFFKKFSTQQKFCEVFYLSEYLNLDYEHPQTINNTKCNHKAFYALGIDKFEYKKFAFGYIAKATELINKRSIKLVEVLKENYKELTK